jgi:hypothetical protein
MIHQNGIPIISRMAVCSGYLLDFELDVPGEEGFSPAWARNDPASRNGEGRRLSLASRIA